MRANCFDAAVLCVDSVSVRPALHLCIVGASSVPAVRCCCCARQTMHVAPVVCELAHQVCKGFNLLAAPAYALDVQLQQGRLCVRADATAPSLHANALAGV